MNKVIDPQVLPYLIAVRERLSAMPTGEAEEIMNDVEQHLAELVVLGTEPLFARLGSADNYAGELALSAGWPPVDLPKTKFGALANRWWQRTWTEMLPGWWVARGALIPLVLFAIYPSASLWPWVWVLIGVGVSVALGRRRYKGFAWRTADWLVTAVAVWQLFAGGLNGIGIYDRDLQNVYLDQNPSGIVGPNGPISDFYAYTVEGEPLEVVLFDQNGLEVATNPMGTNRYPIDPGAAPPDLAICVDYADLDTRVCRSPD